MSRKTRKKKVSFRNMALTGAVIFNPVLIQLAGICPAVAASTDVITAIVFSIVFTIVTLVTCFVAGAMLKNVPRFLRVVIYLIIGTAVICPIMFFLEESGFVITSRIRLYLPLLAVNSVTAVHCEQFSVKHKLRETMMDAFAVSLGFSGVIIIVGFFRELLGAGTIAETPVKLPVVFSGLQLPFGGFIILGFFAMILKWYISRFRPEYSDDATAQIKEKTVTLKEKPVEKAPVLVDEKPEIKVEAEPVFNEFWAPPDIEQMPADVKLKELAKEQEEYSAQADKRIDDLIASIEEMNRN